MDSLAGFYAGKRIFVTGHTGFKGAWLCQWLLSMGCEVTGYALEPGQPSLFILLNLQKHMHSIHGDLCDAAKLASAVKQAKPDILFHLAAQALVLPSYQEPLQTLSTNIMGTAHVLEAARHANVKAIVNVTTDKCYENADNGNAFREDAPLGGHDPYSASKAAAEIISSAWRRSFLTHDGIRMATARAGNVIGGGDFAAYRLIPDIVRAAQSGVALRLRHPGSTRPWQHAFDALRGYLMLGQALMQQEGYDEAFNFAPAQAPMTVGTLTERFIAALKAPVDVAFEPTGVHEAHALQLDSSKAKARLGWMAQLTPEQAVDTTAAWYYAYLHDHSNIAAFSSGQLSLYRGEIPG